MPNKVFRLIIDMDARRAKRGATEASTAFGRLEGRVKRIATANISLGKTFFNLRSAIAAVGFGLFVREALDAAIAVERIQGALRVATGTIEGAGDAFQFVREESERLGLLLRPTAQAFGRLSAAAKGTALEGQATRDIFTSVAEAATVLNLSAEQTQGTLTALEQIISKGKVSAEELRGQLGERLPGAFQIAARSIGVTTAELDKMLVSGALTAEELLPALAAELKNTFGPEVETASQNTLSQINRLKNAVFELFLAVGEELAPAFGELAGTLSRLAGRDDVRAFFASIGRSISSVVKIVGGAISRLDDLQAAMLGTSANVARSIARLQRFIAAQAREMFEFFDEFPEVMRKLSPGLEIARTRYGELAESMSDSADSLEILADDLEDAAAGALKNGADATAKFVEEAANVPPVIDRIGNSAEGSAKKLKELIDQVLGIREAFLELQKVDRESGVISGGIGTPGDEVQTIEVEFDPGDSLEDAAEEFGDEVEGLDWRDILFDLGQALRDAAVEFGGSLHNAIGNAAALAITGLASGASGEQIGAGIGALVGTIVGTAIGTVVGGPPGAIIGAAIGSAIGAIIGGTIGKLFDDDGKGTVFRISVDGEGARILEGNADRLEGVIKQIDQAFKELEQTIGGTIQLTESFNIAVKENDRFFANFFDAAGNAIGSAEFESFEDALAFAMARVLSTAIVDAEGPMADAFKEVLANAAERGLEQTVEDIGWQLQPRQRSCACGL
jgi:tape measure domain-containing protein